MIDVDKLEAGPELDALVAEKVFGWEREFSIRDAMSRGLPSLGFPPGSPAERKTIGGYGYWSSPFNGGKPVPNYSTDIAAAWEVVEKLHLAVIPVEDDNYKPWGWAAESEISVEKEDCDPDSGNYLEVGTAGWTHAKTAPLAICRAALKAVGV